MAVFPRMASPVQMPNPTEAGIFFSAVEKRITLAIPNPAYPAMARRAIHPSSLKKTFKVRSSSKLNWFMYLMQCNQQISQTDAKNKYSQCISFGSKIKSCHANGDTKQKKVLKPSKSLFKI